MPVSIGTITHDLSGKNYYQKCKYCSKCEDCKKNLKRKN